MHIVDIKTLNVKARQTGMTSLIHAEYMAYLRWVCDSLNNNCQFYNPTDWICRST